jgi:hypothetical protein
MDALILTVFLGTATITSYQPIRSQTDDSPTWTSIGDRTTKYGVAVSRDFLESGEIRYGDILKIDGIKGLRVVNDTMNARHKRSVDLLVFTHAEEKRIGTRHGRIWRIRDGDDKWQKSAAGNRGVQKAKREGTNP